ncbi:MAG: bifunctional isocitrate dehydrogenase kinase/phosphatase [bacterium]|nr:bifunctional isocitrate dehydrogenase kinase/phosphatase [bacterium]
MARSTQFPSTTTVSHAAHLILAMHEEHRADFERLTGMSRLTFEQRDWKERQRIATMRLDLYENSLDLAEQMLSQCLGDSLRDPQVWRLIKSRFRSAIRGRYDRDLAETYFNSTTRKILQTVGINRDVEFFSQRTPNPKKNPSRRIFRTYHVNGPTEKVIADILRQFGFEARFRDLEADATLVSQEINLRVWPIMHYRGGFEIDMIKAPFFRNKVAYLVGRIRADGHLLPLILPLYNSLDGIYVDTALLDEVDASIVFSFAFSYFHVQVKWHHELIEFLRSILPSKPLSDLYFSLGYTKHGKTEFYRMLHSFVHESREKFVIAPGKEGAVMIGFTLPDLGYVFKIIKDRPCFLRSEETTSKRTTREEIVRQYEFVCHRDRVGRLVDTQEFENLRFKRKRFSADLLHEFATAASGAVSIEREYVVIHHLYLQRKVTPLPIYLMEEQDAESIRRVVIDFGYFLKDLASIGIFPSDLFNIWNYGVTRRGRVVLFDYDDVCPLEQVNFRHKPPPKNELEELEDDSDRIAAMPNDFFLDETERYSGIPFPLKGIFRRIHGDLYTADFWKEMKRRVRRGELADITPYDRRKKFENRLLTV